MCIRDSIAVVLNFFAYMAIATSFLGVTLGLFDYIADLFKFDDSVLGRTKTTLVTFLPVSYTHLWQMF